ncbi:hypothetical protein Goklo_016716 [Gossypium klotzschianum]|uniref:Uncharacterized protein n=1 Tax=Gossypium klotzschianum TaxID=34286 RepID=A0A7J8UF48_9ROSI|nr:hypothetical protein [Gossypium klotzschianum]
MGGGLLSHKGNGSGSGHKGRPYVLMLLLAFGAALLGVMVLHKFRERRIFNLLIEDKNRQLLSLQLLLQVHALLNFNNYNSWELRRLRQGMRSRMADVACL